MRHDLLNEKVAEAIDELGYGTLPNFTDGSWRVHEVKKRSLSADRNSIVRVLDSDGPVLIDTEQLTCQNE